MLLEYNFAVIGEQRVHQALKGIEARLVQHNARVNRSFAGAARAAGVTPGARAASPGVAVARATRLQERAARAEEQAQKRGAASRLRAENYVFGIRMRHQRELEREEQRGLAKRS